MFAMPVAKTSREVCAARKPISAKGSRPTASGNHKAE